MEAQGDTYGKGISADGCRWTRSNALVLIDVKMRSGWTRRGEHVYRSWGKETTTFRKININFESKTIIKTN